MSDYDASDEELREEAAELRATIERERAVGASPPPPSTVADFDNRDYVQTSGFLLRPGEDVVKPTFAAATEPESQDAGWARWFASARQANDDWEAAQG